MKTKGFTLLEMLVVLAVLGIALSVGFVDIQRWVTTNSIRQAATQVAGDLETLRGNAFKTSQTTTFTLINPTTYSLTYGGTTRNVTIANGVSMAFADSAGPIVSYTAPYGEINVSSRTFKFSKGSVPDQFVYLVGVTGKVTQ